MLINRRRSDPPPPAPVVYGGGGAHPPIYDELIARHAGESWRYLLP